MIVETKLISYFLGTKYYEVSISHSTSCSQHTESMCPKVATDNTQQSCQLMVACVFDCLIVLFFHTDKAVESQQVLGFQNRIR